MIVSLHSSHQKMAHRGINVLNFWHNLSINSDHIFSGKHSAVPNKIDTEKMCSLFRGIWSTHSIVWIKTNIKHMNTQNTYQWTLFRHAFLWKLWFTSQLFSYLLDNTLNVLNKMSWMFWVTQAQMRLELSESQLETGTGVILTKTRSKHWLNWSYLVNKITSK